MRMSWEQLKNLPVVTLAGVKLGHVVGIIFDPETHGILQYEIRQGSAFSRRVLLVSATQVISVTAEKMTVEDLVGMNKAEAETSGSPAANPTITTLASRG